MIGRKKMRLIDADKLPYVNKVILVDDVDGDITITVAKEHTSYVNDEAPTVKAIPIDWILKWANRNCMYCYDYDYPTEKTDGWFDINNMVKDWAKENGLS